MAAPSDTCLFSCPVAITLLRFASIRVEDIHQCVAGVAKVPKKAQREIARFSSARDLKECEDAELQKLLSDVCVSYHKCANVQAVSGFDKFLAQTVSGFDKFQDQGQTEIQAIRVLSPFCDGDIIEDLDVSTLSRVLGLKTLGNHQALHLTSRRLGQPQCQGGFKPGRNSEETVTRLAKFLSELAKQFESQAVERREATKPKGVKEKEVAVLEQKLKRLVSLMKDYVLRVGVGPCRHLGTFRITRLFSDQFVNKVSREMQNCRDRVMQEMTMRKLGAKLNDNQCKRLKLSSNAAGFQ